MCRWPAVALLTGHALGLDRELEAPTSIVLGEVFSLAWDFTQRTDVKEPVRLMSRTKYTSRLTVQWHIVISTLDWEEAGQTDTRLYIFDCM
jgi:hypothetical protein